MLPSSSLKPHLIRQSKRVHRSARGEELTWGTFAQNASSRVMGRGAAGRADKLYGNRIRGIGRGNNSRGRSGRSDLAEPRLGRDRHSTTNTPSGNRSNISRTNRDSRCGFCASLEVTA